MNEQEFDKIKMSRGNEEARLDNIKRVLEGVKAERSRIVQKYEMEIALLDERINALEKSMISATEFIEECEKKLKTAIN